MKANMCVIYFMNVITVQINTLECRVDVSIPAETILFYVVVPCWNVIVVIDKPTTLGGCPNLLPIILVILVNVHLL